MQFSYYNSQFEFSRALKQYCSSTHFLSDWACALVESMVTPYPHSAGTLSWSNDNIRVSAGPIAIVAFVSDLGKKLRMGCL